MATAQSVVTRAFRMLGQPGSGEAPTAQESADGLEVLNDMLDDWKNERLMVYAIQDESITLAATNATRTIGPTGNLVTTRPVKIQSAYIEISNISIPVTVLEDPEDWAAIPDKTSTSTFPNRIYYRPEMPDGKIYLYPVPNASSTLHVLTWTVLTEFASLATTVAFPPGYRKALATNLAVEWAPEFETEPRPSVIKAASVSKANIKRTNFRPIVAYSELAGLIGSRRSNIIVNSP